MVRQSRDTYDTTEMPRFLLIWSLMAVIFSTTHKHSNYKLTRAVTNVYQRWFPEPDLAPFLDQVLTVLNTKMPDIDPLPKKLERLLTWRGLRPSVDASPTDTSITSRHLFYRISWRRYFKPPIMLTPTKNSLLVVSTTETQQLNLKTGVRCQTYQGYCRTDNHERIYLINEQELSLLRDDGQPAWTTRLDYDDLGREFISTKDYVFILDRETLSIVSLKNGKKLNAINESVHTLQVESDWLFTLATTTNIVVSRMHLTLPTEENK